MPGILSRPRKVIVGLGFSVGSAVGLLTYAALQLPRIGIFVVLGAFLGMALATFVVWFSKRATLKEITVSVPQFGELLFTVTTDNTAVAWHLFVESVTRISVQPLLDEAGLIREALDSLYSLFRTTRSILIQARPSVPASGNPAVEHLAIAMLNNEVRPFLSIWHPRLKAWESAHPEGSESDWPLAPICRSELLAVQQHLARYVIGLGELADVPNVRLVITGALGAGCDTDIDRL